MNIMLKKVQSFATSTVCLHDKNYTLQKIYSLYAKIPLLNKQTTHSHKPTCKGNYHLVLKLNVILLKSKVNWKFKFYITFANLYNDASPSSVGLFLISGDSISTPKFKSCTKNLSKIKITLWLYLLFLNKWLHCWIIFFPKFVFNL